MEKEIRQTWHFDHPPKTVWEYLTNSELLSEWLMKNDFKPIVGHKFCFTSGGGMVHNCEVLELKPFTRLSYSWQRKSAKDGKPFDSKVEWTLVAKGEGTDLQIVHNGFAALEDHDQHLQGWTHLVNKLVERVNATKP